MAKYHLSVLFCLVFFISYAYSLSCYDCKGNKDEVCDTSVACGKSVNPNQQAACLKRITKVNGVTNVKRSCTFVTAPKLDRSVECEDQDIVCLTCKEDKCNSAPSIFALSTYAVVAVAVALFVGAN